MLEGISRLPIENPNIASSLVPQVLYFQAMSEVAFRHLASFELLVQGYISE